MCVYIYRYGISTQRYMCMCIYIHIFLHLTNMFLHVKSPVQAVALKTFKNHPRRVLSVAQGLAEASIFRYIFSVASWKLRGNASGCSKNTIRRAENIALKTDRPGSSAELPSIARVTAETRAQDAEAGRKRIYIYISIYLNIHYWILWVFETCSGFHR